MPTLPPHPFQNFAPSNPPPPPFRRHSDAWRAMGFEGQPVLFMPAEDEQPLRDFLLYAQARTRRRKWTIWPVYNSAHQIDTLEVTYGVLGLIEKVNVEYTIPTIRNRSAIGHPEGNGLIWLGIMHVSAYCATMADAVAALDALVPYIPILHEHRQGHLEWITLRNHLRQCLGSDPVRVAAVRRMLRED